MEPEYTPLQLTVMIILAVVFLIYVAIGFALVIKHRREEQESDYVKRIDEDDYDNQRFI